MVLGPEPQVSQQHWARLAELTHEEEAAPEGGRPPPRSLPSGPPAPFLLLLWRQRARHPDALKTRTWATVNQL